MSQMDTIGERTLSKVKWRLVPFVCLLFFIAYIDRTNLGYAALEMNKELGISDVAYGALTSVFYLPYFIFEVPSNMLLNRYGARKWLARIMITWGIVTCLAMFVHNYLQIAAVRFFLGMMEAGFLPGIMFYFTLWLPQRERAKAIALFISAYADFNNHRSTCGWMDTGPCTFLWIFRLALVIHDRRHTGYYCRHLYIILPYEPAF